MTAGMRSPEWGIAGCRRGMRRKRRRRSHVAALSKPAAARLAKNAGKTQNSAPLREFRENHTATDGKRALLHCGMREHRDETRYADDRRAGYLHFDNWTVGGRFFDPRLERSDAIDNDAAFAAAPSAAIASPYVSKHQSRASRGPLTAKREMALVAQS